MKLELPSRRDIFNSAADLRDVGERAAFLDQACGSDHILRAEIEDLLYHDAEATDFLPEHVQSFTSLTKSVPLIESPGMIIGPYTLLEQIGEGGFGVVFKAEQAQPVRRTVALKVIKPGMDSQQIIARFATEQHALSLMDHPNIARVLDAGTTAAGRPYFVMELLQGVPITDYCDQHQLELSDRLLLFLTVCRAVQHAHQKGVIHRDLKPSNVLVTLHNEEPIVKVIDFGIAKAIDQNFSDVAINTGFSQLLGTPLYMSPEQAALMGDIDTRSDLYSLGVMLYELLSGAAPFDKERLKLASFDELRRIIREEDPPAPSNRVSLLGANLPALMTHHMDARRLSKLLKGDLDWVVTKAIDKDRRRRYDSAGDLANDIRRYLANEPVLARPRSAGYRLQKFAQRNRFVLFVTTVVISVVLLAIVNLVLSNAMIRREQERTQEEKARAEKALQLAEDRAEEIRAGLERLVAANAQLERGYWYAEHRRWDDAEKAYTRAVQLRPEDTNALVVRSELRGILGLWTHAATDYAREMELHESELTWRWFRHALLRLHVGDEAGYRHACRRMQELFHGTIAHEMASEVVRTCLLVPNPEVDISRMLEIQGQVVASEPGSWLRQYLMGVAHYRAGEYSQAVECLQTSLTASNEAVRGLSYPVLAMSYFKLGQPVEAQRSLNAAAECLESWTQYRCNIEGGNWVIHRGATIRWPIAWWDWVEFHIYYREARLLIGGMLPSVDPRWHVLTARSLAALRWRDEAEREFATALRLSPNDEQILLESYCNRGDRAIDLKQLDDAIDSYRRAVELQPQNVALWRFLSVAQLAAQDHAGYRQLCAAMVHHFKGTQDRFAACNVLQVCSLLPNAINDLSLLEPLLSIAKSDWHFGTWTRGGALYRMGRTQESLTVLESGAHVYRPSSYEWAFRSMASQRLGNLPEARRCLRESQLWLKQASERSGDDLSGTQPSWGAWDERVQFPLLIREAEELLRGDGASP